MELTIPAFNFPAKDGLHLPNPEGLKAELTGYTKIHTKTIYPSADSQQSKY